MSDEKTHAEPEAKMPSPQVDTAKSKAPEKDDGPAHDSTAHAAPTASNATRAAELLTHGQMTGATRARAVGALQQSVGNTRVARMVSDPPDTTPDRLVQRQSSGQPEQAADRTGPAESTEVGQSAMPDLATPELLQRMAATVLAESWEGQEADIRWVYYNRVMSAKGESGLRGSSAYRAKKSWYRIWLYLLGDHTYGKTLLPQGVKDFRGYATVADLCTKHGSIRTKGKDRAQGALALVIGTFKQPAHSPGKGWTGQGNLNDFNNVSQPNSKYWLMARAYYWLQSENKAPETYVKVLKAGEHTQFMFNADAIAEYYKHHKLPTDVPQVVVPGEASAKGKAQKGKQ